LPGLGREVRTPNDVNAGCFTFSARVTALRRLTGREVFARAAIKLINRKKYDSYAAVHHSIRLLARTPRLSDDDGSEEPSWAGVPETGDLSAAQCRIVLRRAAATVLRMYRKVNKGEVKVISVAASAVAHPWYKNSLAARDRQKVNAFGKKLRKKAKFNVLPLKRRMEVAASGPAGGIALLRELLEHQHPRDGNDPVEDGAPRHRKRRRKLLRGMTMPKVFPTPDEVRALVREAVDVPGGTPHVLLTLGAGGTLRVWRYEVGSATTGERWYRMDNGTRKRLAAPYHRRPRRPPAEPVPTDSATGAMGVPNDADSDGAPGSGIFADAGVFPLGADSGDTEVSTEVDPELLETFQITRSTYLEDVVDGGAPRAVQRAAMAANSAGMEEADGVDGDAGEHSGRELVVAVEFDPVIALRSAFRHGCKPMSMADIKRAPVAVTLAGDGGPVRRCSMTVFTLTASSPLFPSGRTPLIPIMFLLGGEQAIHSAVGERLREQLKLALRTTYIVPVAPEAVLKRGRRPRSTAAKSLPYFIHVCGDFAMISHLLTLTGCGDVNRCPYLWPCMPASYLSALILDGGRAAVRDGPFLSNQWELAVWALARWCTLRDGKCDWRAHGGRVLWSCRGCRRDMVAFSSSVAALACSSNTCPLFEEPQAPLLPQIAYTPLSKFYLLLRRRLGGTRGYPLLGDIPFRIIAPVLHCTGKISKGLMFFLLAIMPLTMRTTARNKIYLLMGRSNMGGMYLREFGRLAALVVALPGVLNRIKTRKGPTSTSTGGGDDKEEDVIIDGGAIVMLQLSQLLTASWRRAIGTKPATERECAAAALQLTAAVLAPIYSALKPLDPITKKAGVFNLYLHTALAHVRTTVGEAYPTLNHVCDDNIEGTIAMLNKYYSKRTNNVSRGQSLINMQAMAPLEFNEPKGRSAAELLILTEELVLCPCLVRLGPSVLDEYKAIVRFTCREPTLTISIDTSAVTALEQTEEAAALVATARSATAAAAAAAAVATAAVAMEAASRAAAAASSLQAPNQVAMAEEATAEPVAAAEAEVVTGAHEAAVPDLSQTLPRVPAPVARASVVVEEADAGVVQADAAAVQAAVVEQAAFEALVGAAPITINLGTTPDQIKTPESGASASVEQSLQQHLRRAQRRIAVCMCGSLSGRDGSAKALEAEMKAADASAVAEEEAAGATKAGGDRDSSGDDRVVVGAESAGGYRVVATEDCPVPSAACGNQVPIASSARKMADDLEGAGGGRRSTDVLSDGDDDFEVYHGDNGEDVPVPGASDDDGDAPAEGDRFYGLDDAYLAGNDSDEDPAMDGDDSHFPPHGSDKGVEAPIDAEFLMQAGAGDDAVAKVLPSADLVDVVFGAVGPIRTAPTKEVWESAAEDLIMLQLFREHLRTPSLLMWAGRDGVLLRDVALAAERLQHSLVEVLASAADGATVA